MAKFDGSIGDKLPDLMADSPLGAGFALTAAKALEKRIATVGRTLPILHNAESDRIRYVLHFSENTEISHFEDLASQSWANVISAGHENVTTITSLDTPQDYKAIYILRVGLAEDEPFLEECDFFCEQPELNLRAGCFEYALRYAIKGGDFGKVLIGLSPCGNNFV